MKLIYVVSEKEDKIYVKKLQTIISVLWIDVNKVDTKREDT